MRRREFTAGLLLASATGARAQERAKQHRIAIVIAGGTVARISETSSEPVSRRFNQAFFEELRRLGDVEGQNLTIDRYSGEGRPEAFPEVAREVVGRNPDVIVASTNPIALAVRGDRHNPDRLAGGQPDPDWPRDEPGAPGRQYHRGQPL